MKLIALNCNHCGAPLEVREKTRFATCAFCNVKLQVHHEGNAVFSEVLEAVQERTEQIADDVARLKLNSELERLDRQWQQQQERLQIRGKDGRLSVPSKKGAYFGMGAVILIGAIVLAIAFSGNASPGTGIFGLFIIGVGIVGGMVAIAKADDYEQNRKRYQRQRLDVIKRFNEK